MGLDSSANSKETKFPHYTLAEKLAAFEKHVLACATNMSPSYGPGLREDYTEEEKAAGRDLKKRMDNRYRLSSILKEIFPSFYLEK